MIEIGLRLDQVRGLESEPITNKNPKSVGDDRLIECGATEEEIDFLRRRRVELNALITERLVELVETALVEHGVTKVIPCRLRNMRTESRRRRRRMMWTT